MIVHAHTHSHTQERLYVIYTFIWFVVIIIRNLLVIQSADYQDNYVKLLTEIVDKINRVVDCTNMYYKTKVYIAALGNTLKRLQKIKQKNNLIYYEKLTLKCE